jgi:hypothetical protein
MHRLFFAITFLAALPAPAQRPVQPPAGSNWQQVQALPIGASIKVAARHNEAKCTLKSVDADTLTCTHGKDIVFQRTDIVNIKVPHRGRSTLVGLAIGAGAGGIAGFASTGPCGNNCILGRGTVATAGALGLGAVGAIVGVLTDFTRSTVYKAP